MTIYNGMVFSERKLTEAHAVDGCDPRGDVTWWVEWLADIKSTPDFSDPKLALHNKYGCCDYFRIIYSYRMQDHAGVGRKEIHKAYCGRCAKPMAGGAALRHLVTTESSADYVIYFGKHKGKKLSDVPRDYLEWCLKADFKDKKIIKNIEAFLSQSP